MTQNRFLRIFTIFLIVFLAIFNYIDRAILVPNGQYILMDLLGYSALEAMQNTSMITTLHTIFKWTAAAFTILYGYLNDKYPRKYILAIGTLTFGICSIITANVASYSQLVALQMITAVCIGASLPTSYSILSDLSPPKNRGKTFGIFGISTILGDLIGNLLISLVYPATESNLANWRPPFLIVGGISITLTILLIILVKEPKRGGQEDALREVLSNESIEYSYRIRKEDLKEVYKNKTNFWLIMNFVDNIFGGYILANAIPWLRTEHYAAPEVAGILVIVPATAILLGTLFWGAIGDIWFKKDKAARVKVSILCLTVSLAVFPLAVLKSFNLQGKDLGQTFADPDFGIAFAIFWIFFFFNNGIGPNWHAIIIDANRVEHRGSMLSVATFFEEFGEGLGLLIGGVFHDLVLVNGSATPYQDTFLLLTIFTFLGILMWLPLVKTIRKDIEAVDAVNVQRAQELQKNTE